MNEIDRIKQNMSEMNEMYKNPTLYRQDRHEMLAIEIRMLSYKIEGRERLK